MDEIFDKLKDGATKAKDSAEKFARVMAKRTSNAITHTKLTYSANEVNGKIKEIYEELGKELYQRYLDGEESDAAFRSSFEQIDKLMEEVEMIQSKIAELKNSLKCDNCGAFNSAKAEYCSQCGSKLDEQPQEDSQEDVEFEGENEAYVSMEFADADDNDENVIVINPKKPE